MSKGTAFGMKASKWSVGSKRAGNPKIEDYGAGSLPQSGTKREANQGPGKSPSGKVPNMKDCKY